MKVGEWGKFVGVELTSLGFHYLSGFASALARDSHYCFILKKFNFCYFSAQIIKLYFSFTCK